MPVSQTSAAVADHDNILHTDHNALVTDMAAVIAAINAAGSVPVRQTVLEGKVTAGVPSFLQNDTSSISLDASSTDPLVLTWAAGFDAAGGVNYLKRYTSDQASFWSSLTASKTLYLFADYGAGTPTGGFTEYPPDYQATEPPGKGIGVSNIATGAQAISDSESGTRYDNNAFDGDSTEADFFQTNTDGASLSGVGFIGQDFGSGVTKQVAQVVVVQYSNASYTINSGKAQWSNDGTNWFDIGTYALNTGATSTTLTLAAYTAARYFRLLANQNLGGGFKWCVREITLYEAALVAEQYWFDLNTFKMKRYTGSAWAEVSRLFLGECVTNGSSNVTSLTTYALRGQYLPNPVAMTLSSTTKNHNIGTNQVIPRIATSAGVPINPTALDRLSVTFTPTTGATHMQLVRAF